MAGTGSTLLAFDRWRTKVEQRRREGRPQPRSPFVEAALGYDHLEAGALAQKPGRELDKLGASQAEVAQSAPLRPGASGSHLGPSTRPASRAELMDPEFWREQREKEDL